MISPLLLSTYSLISWSLPFFPERGSYHYSLQDIVEHMNQERMSYVKLESPFDFLEHKFKWNANKNEYQVKDWFLQDWYSRQEMFKFDLALFVSSQNEHNFNDAKIKQYQDFHFNFKKFYHYKTIPSLKEWGGLTHPPLRKLHHPLTDYHKDFYIQDYSKMESPYFDPKLQMEIDEVSGSELTFDNELEIFADHKSFLKKKELILKAKNSILMSSLVFVCDPSTKEIVDLLIRKHQENVKVRVIVDGFISKLLSHRECPRQLRKAGIEVIETFDFFKHKLKAIYHTKTLIVDFEEAVAGGQNMIDADNTSKGTDFKNRDIDLYVKGPMVTDIAKQFLENWEYQLSNKKVSRQKDLSFMSWEKDLISKQLGSQKIQGLRGQKFYHKSLKDPSSRMKGVCRFIKQAPYEDRHSIGKAYLLLLEKLQKHLIFTDPIRTDTVVTKRRKLPLIDRFDSFEMYNLLHTKVLDLHQRNIQVDYITTNINMAGNENVAIMNERIKQQLEVGKNLKANWSYLKLLFSNKYFGKSHYKNLLQDWVGTPLLNVWTHISFMHSKIFYFDRIVASIGSLNFQHNATDQAYESTSICMDEKLNNQLDQELVLDMANSIPLVYSH